MKLLPVLVTCLILGLILAGCSSSANLTQSIVGKWEMEQLSNTYEFLSDGTGSISSTAGGTTFSVGFSYQFTQSNEITVNYDNGDSLVFQVAMPDNNTLILTSTSPNQTFTFHRL